MAAHRDGAAFHIPEACDQLRQRRFAAARRADQRSHAVLRDGEADAVQDLLVVVIAERDVLNLNVVRLEGDGRVAVFLLLCVQELVHLIDRCTDLRERVDKVERCDDRRGHAERQDDGREERLDRECPVRVEQPAEREHRQHLGREEGIGHRHAELAAAHPVVIVLCIGLHLLGQPGVGSPPLVERLDDLDAVDVLDHRAAHLVRRVDCALKVLGIAAHDRHHEHERDREYRQ